MDDSALQNRLSRLERRVNLVLVLLLGPYVVGAAELLGLWAAAVLTVTGAFAILVALVVVRRRNRDTAGE